MFLKFVSLVFFLLEVEVLAFYVEIASVPSLTILHTAFCIWQIGNQCLTASEILPLFPLAVASPLISVVPGLA